MPMFTQKFYQATAIRLTHGKITIPGTTDIRTWARYGGVSGSKPCRGDGKPFGAVVTVHHAAKAIPINEDSFSLKANIDGLWRIDTAVAGVAALNKLRFAAGECVNLTLLGIEFILLGSDLPLLGIDLILQVGNSV